MFSTFQATLTVPDAATNLESVQASDSDPTHEHYVFAYDPDRTYAQNLWDCQDLLDDPAYHNGFLAAIASAEAAVQGQPDHADFDSSLGIPISLDSDGTRERFFQVLLERSPNGFRQKFLANTSYPVSIFSTHLKYIDFVEGLANDVNATRETILTAMSEKELGTQAHKTIAAKLRRTIGLTHPRFQAQCRDRNLMGRNRYHIQGICRPTDLEETSRDDDQPVPDSAVLASQTSNSPAASTPQVAVITELPTEDPGEDLLVPVPDGYSLFVDDDSGGTVYLRGPDDVFLIWNEEQGLWEDLPAL